MLLTKITVILHKEYSSVASALIECTSLLPNLVLTLYTSYHNFATSNLLPLRVPSVYQQACSACLIGLLKSFRGGGLLFSMKLSRGNHSFMAV